MTEKEEELKEKQKEMDEFKAKIAMMDALKLSLTEQIEKMTTEMKQNKDDIKVKNNKIIELQRTSEDVEVLATAKADLQEKLTNNEIQVSDSQTTIEELEQKIKDLTAQLEEKSTQASEVEDTEPLKAQIK